MLVLIGSHALNHWLPGYRPHPSDIDYIASFDQFVEWCDSRSDIKQVYPASHRVYVAETRTGIVEFEIALPGSSTEEILQRAEGERAVDGDWLYMIPNLDWLFTLKASHRYLKDSPHFMKTLQDYHFLKRLGCKIVDKELLKRREVETYNALRPRLNRDKKNFFSGDGVKYIYDHDSLHEAVRLGDRPAYTYYATDGQEVLSSKQKFFDLPHEVRINGVLEESYVLALERSQIPYRGKIRPRDSFMLALSKVCTSITSGWFREFAYENWFEAVSRYNDTYVDMFDIALAGGIVKPFK